jgi:hypothetical protein
MSYLLCYDFISFAINQVAKYSDWQPEISSVASLLCQVVPEGSGFEIILLLLVLEF